MWLFSRVNSLGILETIIEFLVLGKAMYIRLAEKTHLDGYISLHKFLSVLVHSAGPSLEWVPRVPGTRDILSSYVMAPVNFSEISG